MPSITIFPMLSPASTLIKLISSANRISASSTLVASAVEKIADFHQQIIWKPLKTHSFTRKQRGCQLKELVFLIRKCWIHQETSSALGIERNSNTHRIHGAGIYANIWGILMVNVTIYSSTMDPSWVGPSPEKFWDLVDLIKKTTDLNDLTNQIMVSDKMDLTNIRNGDKKGNKKTRKMTQRFTAV